MFHRAEKRVRKGPSDTERMFVRGPREGTFHLHILLSVEEAASLLPVGSNLQAVISPCDCRSSAGVPHAYIARLNWDTETTRWMKERRRGAGVNVVWIIRSRESSMKLNSFLTKVPDTAIRVYGKSCPIPEWSCRIERPSQT